MEHQFVREQEAERAALDNESERLRLASIALRDRLRTFASAHAFIRVSTRGGDVSGTLTVVGADWFALDDATFGGVLIHLSAVTLIGIERAIVASTTRNSDSPRRALEDTMTWGFVMRDLMRRRRPVTVTLSDGKQLSGTIDRAGVDHLELALHDRGTSRRESQVTGARLVPFNVTAWVRVDST
nr:hypothetical protein [Microbacterium endophyticum]